MSILSSDHLPEQADRLIIAPGAGPPRQVDLRRAVSATYYAIFHFVTTSLADEFVGVTLRTSPRYGLVYRSVDHKSLRELCTDISKSTPPQKLRPFLPQGGIGHDMIVFSNAVTALQEQRHRADYDPVARYRTGEVKTIIQTGRSGIARFRHSSDDSRKAFMTLLLASPR